MFLVAGVLLVACLVLAWLYFFVFQRLNKYLSWIVLAIVSGAFFLAPTMHTIFLALLIFIIGSFMIKFIHRNQRGNN